MKMEYTSACDVYSFGIIVFEIMTCQNPWNNLSIYQIQRKIESGVRPEFNCFIPDSYKNLIKKCWEQDPCDRPTFDKILEELKNDEGFITDLIDHNDYLDYIAYIENTKTDFGKNPIQIDQYIKRKSKTFTKISLNLQKNSIKNARKSIDISSNKNEKNKTRKFSLFKKHKKINLYPSQEFNELDIANQQLVQESNGDPEKEFKIAEYLIEGNENFPQNTELGLLYLEHSVKSGCIEASIYYSTILIKGEIIPKNYEKARKLLKKFKKGNNASVFLILGKIKKKQGDFMKAAKYFEKSSSAGSTKSMYEYGKMLQKGIGCQKNEKEAKYYFEMAKRNGYKKSEKFLDPRSYYKNIADNGSPEDSYYYANLIDTDHASNEDKLEALPYYKKAADEGNIEAMVRYATFLEKGEIIDKDTKEASKYYKNAAENGNINSMVSYARLVHHHKSADNDYELAGRFAKKSADKGNIDGMLLYGKMILFDKEINANYEEAAKYIKMSADKGNIDGMLLYGKILHNGNQIEQNRKESIRYIKMAADNGNIDGFFYYGLMLRYGIGVEQNYKNAAKYFKKAADNNNKPAMYNYGLMLINGTGVNMDKKKGDEYIKMATDLGYVDEDNHYYRIHEKDVNESFDNKTEKNIDQIVIMRPLRSILYDEKKEQTINRFIITSKSKYEGTLKDLIRKFISNHCIAISYCIEYYENYKVNYFDIENKLIQELPSFFSVQVKPHKGLPYRVCTLLRNTCFEKIIDINKECFSFAIKFPQKPTLDGIIEDICNYLFQKLEENNPVDKRLYHPSIYFDDKKQFKKINDIENIIQNETKPIFVIWESFADYDFVMNLIQNHTEEQIL